MAFKNAMRYVVANDMHPEHQPLFFSDKRQWLSRLKPLAIIGHHPAIQAEIVTTAVEDSDAEDVLIRQKVGGTAKLAGLLKAQKTQAQQHKAKRARFDFNGAIRWRCKKPSDELCDEDEWHDDAAKWQQWST